MSRTTHLALVVSGVVLVLLVLAVVVFRKPPPEGVHAPPAPGMEGGSAPPMVSPPDVRAVKAEASSVVAPPASVDPEQEQEREYDDVATAEEGLRSMGASLSDGDTRTPALSEDVQRQKPTPDVLNDPAAYEAFEQSQSRSIAAGYLSIINQVPAMRARIEEAKISGQMSPEEIAEAEEAVQKILELEQEMTSKDPELVNEVRNAGAAPTPTE